MGAVFLVLAVAGYLGFLIDWKELGGVMRIGGWAAGCLYLLLAVLICAVLATPSAVGAGVIH
jgi:hypothetical protein